MKPIRISRVALMVAVVAVQAELVACTPSEPSASVPTPSSTMTDAQIIATGRQYSQCMREHGFPTFGEPELKSDGLAFTDPEGVTPEQLQPADEACKHFLASLPQWLTEPRPVSEADMASLLRFAQCMRANGIPEWPDPKSDGTFPLRGTPLEGKSTLTGEAQRACRQHWDNGISVS